MAVKQEKIKFTAEIKDGMGGGKYVEIPFDVEKIFGKKRVKIQALIEGKPYRGSIMRMGTECHILGILKDIRAAIQKDTGDTITVEIWEDTEPREVTVPDDVRKQFEQAGIWDSYNKLAFTHQREYMQWITGAKKDETRMNRINKAIALLKQGKKEPH